MNFISGIALKERKRLMILKESYEEQIRVLPKGSIQKRKHGNCIYYYLAYRAGDKVISEYIGNTEDAVTELREQIEKRKHMQGVVAKLQEELKLIDKFTGGTK